jgi:hypothetical protein
MFNVDYKKVWPAHYFAINTDHIDLFQRKILPSVVIAVCMLDTDVYVQVIQGLVAKPKIKNGELYVVS